MAGKYLTLKVSDASFSSYLWGTFAEDKRAIPIKSYNLGTPEEMVTFEVRENADIETPSFLKFWNSLFKLRSFIIVLFPLYFVLVKNRNFEYFDVVSMICATAAVKFLFAGMNIRNDVNDHISGFDRVNLDLAQKPIRRGWVTAARASTISNLFIFAAAIFAVPSLLLNPALVYLVGLVLALIVAGELVKKNSYKNQHFGEFTLFVLSGPLLLAGLQLACGAVIDYEIVVFGILWGLGVLFLVQVNNFSHIMTSSQNGILNTMTKLGFDLSQRFLVFCWGVFLFFWCVFQFNFHNEALAWAGTAFLIGYSLILFRDLLYIKSPMGSGLRAVRHRAYEVFMAAVFILFLQSLRDFGVI